MTMSPPPTPPHGTIDVRSWDEFLHEAIPGSRCIPLAELSHRLAELSRTDPLCVICQRGARSTEALRQLQAAGFTNVVAFAGGIEAYKASGGTTVRQRAVIPLQRQVLLGAGSLILTSLALATWWHPAWLWVTAGIGSGLVFAGATGFCGMAKLLERMPWNRLPRAAASTRSCCS